MTASTILRIKFRQWPDRREGRRKKLQIEDWFMPSNWFWLQKRDLDIQVTPAIFHFRDKELMVTGSKECRVYLLDTRTPAAMTTRRRSIELRCYATKR